MTRKETGERKADGFGRIQSRKWVSGDRELKPCFRTKEIAPLKERGFRLSPHVANQATVATRKERNEPSFLSNGFGWQRTIPERRN